MWRWWKWLLESRMGLELVSNCLWVLQDITWLVDVQCYNGTLWPSYHLFPLLFTLHDSSLEIHYQHNFMYWVGWENTLHPSPSPWHEMHHYPRTVWHVFNFFWYIWCHFGTLNFSTWQISFPPHFVCKDQGLCHLDCLNNALLIINVLDLFIFIDIYSQDVTHLSKERKNKSINHESWCLTSPLIPCLINR